MYPPPCICGGRLMASCTPLTTPLRPVRSPFTTTEPSTFRYVQNFENEIKNQINIYFSVYPRHPVFGSLSLLTCILFSSDMPPDTAAVCVYITMYIYIHTHTHTHTYVYIRIRAKKFMIMTC